MLRWNWEEAYPEGPSLDDLKHLQDELRPNELAARQALADAIAEELATGYRLLASRWRDQFPAGAH